MKRRQLTLFLDDIESIPIESIRKKYNPKQYELIHSHITLIREDEIEDWGGMQDKLRTLELDEFKLKANGLKRFAGGKGVLIEVLDEDGRFRRLRELILQNEDSPPRDHKPHITLMHPRNSVCDDEIFQEIQAYSLPEKLRIQKIGLIEQEIGQKWITLEEFYLKRNSPN